MPASYETDLYRRLKGEIDAISVIDTHEHLQRESELPTGDDVHFGRFFLHYAGSDLVSAGMPPADLQKLKTDTGLTPKDRWKLIAPWYAKTWNTAYFEAIRIALRDIYDIDDLSEETVDDLTARMGERLKPGFTREVFDMAGIDYAMNNPFGPNPVFNPDFGHDCFICDMVLDWFTALPLAQLSEESGIEIWYLDDLLRVIDFYFERDADAAGAAKVGMAYGRKLYFEDVPKSAVEGTFNKLFRYKEQMATEERRPLEDFLLHYLVKKCGEYDIRMKFHTGLQEGNANFITNSRAAHMLNLFNKYPKTKFDMYHISYPYDSELTVIGKNFPNVTIDFCWMWAINPAAARRALSEMLDTVPANKIHGFGGDYIFVEGTYGHLAQARQGVTRVLCKKVEEGRYTEDYALKVARMLFRENALENFGLEDRRKKSLERAEKQN